MNELALFPLNAVLFPDGLLSLKVFEARYLDLISVCLRENRPFGVIALQQGSEVHSSAPGHLPAVLEKIGCLASILTADAQQTGIMQVRCQGGRRFAVQRAEQAGNGLWTAQIEWLDDDERLPPQAHLLDVAKSLAQAIIKLKQQGQEPFLKPYQFQSAGWVANRWCEIVPIPVAAKQKLMELANPMARLELISDYLHGKGVIG